MQDAIVKLRGHRKDKRLPGIFERLGEVKVDEHNLTQDHTPVLQEVTPDLQYAINLICSLQLFLRSCYSIQRQFLSSFFPVHT